MSNKKQTSRRRDARDYKSHDHYQDVTDRIVAGLEAGTRPWQQPWDPERAGGAFAPVNGATGHRYRGINTLMLGMSMLAFVNNDPRWQTYKQAAEKGWQVRKGERGSTVFFFKQLPIEDRNAPSDGDENTKHIPIMRSFIVFHASQIENIPPYVPPTIETAPWQRIEAADLILKNSKAQIRTGGDRAFYSPSTDHIQLPCDIAFASPEGHAATFLHELSHWAGAGHRLNRDLTGRFGSERYAKEELVGEFSSIFVGTALNLPTDIPNHTSYLASWIKILKNEKREIFRAAAAAQKSADYILAFHPDFPAKNDNDSGDRAEDSALKNAA